jgi:hypothetical protein
MSPADARYGRRHQQLRRQLAGKVAAGKATCWRCGKPIKPNEPWDLGHHDDRPDVHAGPEHRRCNRSTLRRMLAKARGESDGYQGRGRSRDW